MLTGAVAQELVQLGAYVDTEPEGLRFGFDDELAVLEAGVLVKRQEVQNRGLQLNDAAEG